ncbi:deoxycytidylate deaminase [Shewanella mangrovi]|uniref:diguanylate cyclase n=1 Tax=Shewanella mangrovi TaxID=1515746 RepID=A0A094JGM4_9GAMM|nr:GGDEF domain-containing protein [Shewanella mangrovi]KFZ37184.1 deoxycytidylate deaminase [Shewanella mangrovi]
MKDANAGLSQQTLMKQKLETAQIALAELKEDRNAKLRALSGFIGHLSLACKGQNLELDNKLAKLRASFSDVDRLDDILPELVDIERILKRQYSHVMTKLEQGRNGLVKFSRQLQRVESVPDKLRKEVNYFKQDVGKPFHTVWDYIPKVEQLISFYEQTLALCFDSEEPITYLPKYRQLAHELAQMISEIDFSKAQRDQVLVIKEQLATEIDIDALLESYQTILSMLLENIAKEKSASQEFLFALNEALMSVRDSINESLNQAQRNQQLKNQLNKDINSQVDNVESGLAVADNMEQMKHQVIEQLAVLRASLNRKEALEQREVAMLKKSVETLRNEINELTSETSSYKEKLFEQQKLNLLDSLTQLPNRAALDERMEQEYRHYQRNRNPLWVAVADIDHFKAINDSFGHSTGDKTLQVIAMALKNSLRDTEFVARYGGEEFVLLIPDVSHNDIGHLLNRVREKIKNIPFKFKNQRITVTLSIGAAKIIEGEHILETFERADAALYKAKHENRDRVIID